MTWRLAATMGLLLIASVAKADTELEKKLRLLSRRTGLEAHIRERLSREY